MKAVLLIALFGVSMINAAFFGCTMRLATTSVTPGGSGNVACYSGLDDAVPTLACTFSYLNITSAPSAAHLHVGTDAMDGNPTFYFDTTLLVSTVSGSTYQKFVATNTNPAAPPSWVMAGSTSFADQITSCASGSGCYFNLHTANFGGGELRCELQPLTTLTYDFTVPLVPAVPPLVPALGAAVNASASFGTATIQMAAVGTGGKHAWGYQVAFSLASHISNAHIHQGSSTTDNSGAPKVFLDYGAARNTGAFVGVALEGVATGKSYWPSYAADFDTAMASHFNYINIHSVGNGGGEIRASVAPNGAAQATLSVIAVVALIASWMSL